MKTLLVLSQHPDFAEAIRTAADPESFRVVHRLNVDEAEPLLHGGLFNASILEVDPAETDWVWTIEKLRRRAPQTPILVFTESRHWEWEEEAYLMGVTHVLLKPVRARLLNAVLNRSLAGAAPAVARPTSPGSTSRIASRPEESGPAPLPAHAGVHHSLEISRQFSAILAHSLDAQAMMKKFLLLLREMLGVNRAAVFLQVAAPSLGGGAVAQSRTLGKCCAIGLPSGLLEHFELTYDSGIGGSLYRTGRILRRWSEEAREEAQVQQEFELLGAQVALPILDGETLIGVAVLDSRITGEPLSNPELELIFHLLEELGLAIKNTRLHDQLAANHELLGDVFRQLNSACVIVSQDLRVLHANKTARSYFSKASRRHADLEFSDLPPALGGKVFQVLKTGTALAPFRFQPEDTPTSVYNVSVVPFRKQGSALPESALLMAEDLSQAEQLQRLEVEAANLRLITTMADRLAHEIGNALVPLSTHQQLLKERFKDPEFRATLDTALSDSVKRVSRLTTQMRFLARESVASSEIFPMEALIEDAYEEARKHQPTRLHKLDYQNGTEPIIVTGDRAALKHALSEIILNALQANPTDPKIGVRIHAEANGADHKDVTIEIQDNGSGFSTEAGKKVPTPFYTTRNVGLGLGLTVSRKIIETHHGKLEIVSSKAGQSGVVRVTLPLPPEAMKAAARRQ
jgi:signal transduction histidine kinase/DNA-binding NarL/FixJ family response regulator/GAF domain-containing protein